MTRTIETILSEALQRLETSGRLDVATFAAAYPEHAAELGELLPVMLELHTEQRWEKADSESRAFAVGLFGQLVQVPAAAPQTLGTLLTHERERTGLTVEEQARLAGLPADAIQQLAADPTPVSALDNVTIKQLAVKVAAPFTLLLKEIRRLVHVQQLSGASAQAVFTRDKDTSTETEKQLLMEKVREAATRTTRDPQEPQ